ncbi:glutathione peroxidase [Oceanobacillus jeddahense]|uniref:glutathione peroxidase n=1 Tax=Oceanobacillus jeddahense TaxID=1462527 RepID=UPI000595BFDA|nr:glutathione peroxidase [Oceanobacillus jeddahense]
MTTIYDFSAKTMAGEEKSLSDYKGKVLLIVNTASKCGFTPQFEGLQRLYEKYKEQGFEVLGFPCNQFGHQDPGADEEINQFCQQNYGVTFQMFSKVDVKGNKAHPLFDFLTTEQKGILGEQIKWNFTKFLIDTDGKVSKRFGPQKNPDTIEKDIEALLH